MKKYSVIVPVYNEEKNISLLYSKLSKIFKNKKWELIFVNDASTDNSLFEIKKLADKNYFIKYISFSRNFGHQAALTAGLDNALGDAVISMDCDLQDPPEIIPAMIKKWEEGADVVYARRKNRKDNLFKKYTAIWYYKLLHKFSEVEIPRNVGDFRLVDKKVLNELKNMKEKARYLRGMVAWLGFKYDFVDFIRPERIHGQTNYTLKKMIRLASDGILNFSLLPLKLGMMLGLLSILVGVFFLIYMVLDTLLNASGNISYYELYKWLSVSFLILLGFLFVCIWIIGEYIGRIYNESKQRPLYVIKERK